MLIKIVLKNQCEKFSIRTKIKTDSRVYIYGLKKFLKKLLKISKQAFQKLT